MDTKTYSELIQLQTFKERLDYLKLDSVVCEETFGVARWLNQKFYHSYEWRKFRNAIIARDNGWDLGLVGFDIPGLIIIHHLNPITYEDIVNRRPCVLDPENAISVSANTHRAIHYSDDELLTLGPAVRQPNDMCPWK